MGKYESISIIIPAWRVAEYIGECIDSLKSQTYFKNNSAWEILIGIDACEETKRAVENLDRNNLRIFWFPEHKGPYVIRTTLAYLASHDRLLFFDADDVADNELIEYIIRNSARPTITFRRQIYGANEKKGKIRFTLGIFSIKKRLFEHFGGFQPWLCGADSEFFDRVKRAGINKYRLKNKFFVKRRIHGNNLTRRTDTGFKSELRNQYIKLRKKLKKTNTIRIDPITAEYNEI